MCKESRKRRIIIRYKQRLKAYDLAINARNQLKQDYNTWMNFFYIANSAVLIALTTGKIYEENSIRSKLFLSIIGLIVAFVWHLSIRGYRYWMDNWTRIMIKRENEYFGNRSIYGVLAQELKEEETLLGYNNISTPKLLQKLSIIIISIWIIYIAYLICQIEDIECKCLFIGIGILVLATVFLFIICDIKSDTSLHEKIETKSIVEKNN